MKKSIYCDWIDLEWYFGVAKVLSVQGQYPFDSVEPAVVSVQEILHALDYPQDLSIERQRAICLLVAGTSMETSGIIHFLREKCAEDDVFFETAMLYSKDAELREYACRCIVCKQRDSLEERIFSMIPFAGRSLSYLQYAISDFIEKFAGYRLPVCGNEKLYYWLLQAFGKGKYGIEVLCLLNSVVNNGVDLSSKTAAILKMYSFYPKDLYRIAFVIRHKNGEYARAYVKNQRAREQYSEWLVNTTEVWSDEDFYLIQNGRIKPSGIVVCIENYAWLYEEMGWKPKQLPIDFNVPLDVKRRRGVLTEHDFNQCVLNAELDDDSIRKLKLSFNEWDPIFKPLLTVCQTKKQHLLYTKHLEFSEVLAKYGENSREAIVWLENILYKKVPTEEICVIEEFMRKKKFKDYRTIMHGLMLRHSEYVMSDEARQYYDSFYSFDETLLLEYGVEALKGVPRSIFNFRNLLKAVLNGGDLSGVSDAYYGMIDSVLKKNYDLEEILNAISVLGEQASNSRVENLLQLGSLANLQEYETAMAFAGYYGVKFRKIVDLNMLQVLRSLDSLHSLGDNLHVTVYNLEKNERYASIVSKAFKEFVCAQTAVSVLNSYHSIEALTNYCGWCNEWLKCVEKPVEDLYNLGSAGVNYGYVNGVRCVLTDIGIIAESPVDCGIPCWVLDDLGEVYSVFIGVAFDSLEYFGGTIHHDSTLELRLRRCC